MVQLVSSLRAIHSTHLVVKSLLAARAALYLRMGQTDWVSHHYEFREIDAAMRIMVQMVIMVVMVIMFTIIMAVVVVVVIMVNMFIMVGMVNDHWSSCSPWTS